MEFWITFVENQFKCTHKKCFLGWVSKYISFDGETGEKSETIGFPDAKGPQPVFKFETDGKDDDDYEIIYDNSLSEAWKQIIEIACEKFNPFDVSEKRKFAFKSVTVSEKEDEFALAKDDTENRHQKGGYQDQ